VYNVYTVTLLCIYSDITVVYILWHYCCDNTVTLLLWQYCDITVVTILGCTHYLAGC